MSRMKQAVSTIGMLIVFVLAISASAFAGSITNWELVYETDANGTCVQPYCTLSELGIAIKEGATVKVVRKNVDTGAYNSTIMTNVSVAADGSVWSSFLTPMRAANGTWAEQLIFMRLDYMSNGWVNWMYLGSANRPADEEKIMPLKWYVSR